MRSPILNTIKKGVKNNMVIKREKVVLLVRGKYTLSGKPHVSFGTPGSTKKGGLGEKFNRSTRKFKNFPTAKKFAISKAKKLGLKKVEVANNRDIKVVRRKK